MTEDAGPCGLITVIGGGAMGTLFAARLGAAGLPVQMIVRTAEQAEAIQASGLRLVESYGGTVLVRPMRVVAAGTVSEGAAGGSGLVVVAVKAYSTAAVGGLAASVRAPGGLVLSLQNGLGNAETLLTAGVPADRLLMGVTTEAATASAPGCSIHQGAGYTVLGPQIPGVVRAGSTPSRQQAAVLQALARAGFAVEWQDPIEPRIWAKVAINVAINPATALLEVPNGHLLAQPDVLAMMRVAVAEVEAVAAARGTRLPAGAGWPQVVEVLRATAANCSSMLQDLRHRRPTEVDALCGAVGREGRRFGIATPVNDCLQALVAARSSAGLRHTA